MSDTSAFTVDQVVRGAVSGVFVVRHCFEVVGSPHYLVQEVNPQDHTEVARGPLPPPYRGEMLRPY